MVGCGWGCHCDSLYHSFGVRFGAMLFFLNSSRAQGNHSGHSSSFSNDSKQSTQIISNTCIQWFRVVLVRWSGYVWFVLVFLVKFLFEAMGATEATVDEASLAQDVASVLGRHPLHPLQ